MDVTMPFPLFDGKFILSPFTKKNPLLDPDHDTMTWYRPPKATVEERAKIA